ncbi:acyltransferase family protein [Methylotenera sp. L2L1]|uniref:acyltransferase family protein n=1 Tax=Methylotenera sp. L2L1 TaxID=1502770 RepID=UPI0005630E12|nr:acyltransferase [Methylotenera sp. L2L1]
MINNIQILRAFAAINVVLTHIIGTSTSYYQDTFLLRYFEGWGGNGVDIFFVISGYVMLHTQIIQRRTPYEFFKNRVVRIVPIYWALTFFVLMLYFVFPSVTREILVTPVWVVSSLFFTSSIFTSNYPVVYVGWTLEFEMFFYLIFSIGLFLKSWRLQVTFVVISLLTFTIITNNFIIVEFLLGMFVACIFRTYNFSKRKGLAIFIFGTLLLLASISSEIKSLNLNRIFIWGIPSFFIVFGLLYSTQVKCRSLVYLGNASYSIYLVQILTIPAFYKLFSKVSYDWNGDFLAFLCLVFSVTFGCVVYSVVEKPLTEMLKRFI